MTKKINNSTHKTFEYPVEGNDKYTQQDWKAVHQVIDWLNADQTTVPGGKRRRTQATLAQATGASRTVVNFVLSGTYVSSPAHKLRDMLEFIAREHEREQFQMPLQQTSVYKTAFLVCSRAHRNKDLGLLSGAVGIGKTESLKDYARLHSGVYMVESDPNMSETVLLTYLVEKTSANVLRNNRYSRGTKAERFSAVVRKLRGTDSLIIVDEANRIMNQTMESLRRISDLAEVGVVLAGRESLHSQLEDELGRHGEIASRIGCWLPVIHSITPADSMMIVKQAFSHLDKPISESIVDTFWQMCGGKARTLVKLIRNVTEVMETQGHELSTTLVLETGQSLMGISRPRKRIGGVTS